MKKIFLILISVIFLGGVAFFLFPYIRPYFSSSPANGLPRDTVPPPSATTPQIRRETDESIFSYWLSDNGDIFYIATDGTVHHKNKNTNEIIATQKITDLQSLATSANGAYAVLAFGPHTAPTFSLFTVKDKAWQPLPAGVTSATWDRTQNRLLYLKRINNLTALDIFDPATKKTTELLHFPSQGVKLISAGANTAILSESPSLAAASSLFSINLKNRSVSLLREDAPGLVSVWSADSSRGLIFTNSYKENSLLLSDGKGTSLGKLPFGITLPSKCVLETGTIFCAVPKEIPPSVTLPDDWLMHAFYSEDQLLSFDEKTNEVKVLFDDPSYSIDAEQLSRRGNTLYFINRYDQKLYSVEIEK